MIEDLHIVEVVGSVAGAYAAKLLADRGAQVESLAVGNGPPDRDPAIDRYLTAGCTKQVVTDREAAVPFLAGADIVIQSSSPDPLISILDDMDDEQGRIDVRISPFGAEGPWSGFRSTELTDQAISGHLFLNGDPDREPLQGPEHQVSYAAGLHAAIGALAAVLARSTTGEGQQVEVTHQEVMTALHQFTLFRYTHNGDILTRMGNRYAGPGHPAGVYPCRDGLISLIAPRGDQVETLLAITGLDHLLERPGIGNVYDLMHHPTLLDEHLGPWLADQKLEETIDLFQAVRVPATSVATMADVLADEHLNERGALVEIDGPAGPVRVPRSPLRTSVADRVPARPSPPAAGLADGPLTGVRVLDLTRVWAGPYATRVLADLGAEVIMIEAPWARGGATVDDVSVTATRYYPDNEPGDKPWNRNGFSNKFNLNKKNLALDLSKPAGLAVLETLVAEVDVLIENYSPRVMPQFGLDEARLREINPALVYITMPGFGRSGPSKDHVAYGPVVDSQAGLSVLMGYEGEKARKAGVAWPDPVAGMHAAFATVASLVDRVSDGAARTVELAQIEATIAVVGHAIAEYQLSGLEPEPHGNRHVRFAPHGVYRCAGEDRWLAIAIVDERSWHGLCETAGFDGTWKGWTEDHRRSEQDRIDQELTNWTSGGRQEELMERLQAAGVAAATVADAAQVMADPHLNARDAFVAMAHPEAGTHLWPKLPIRLSKTRATYRRPGPNLNHDGPNVLRELAGYDDAAIAGLFEAGVISDRPPG